MCMAKMFFGSEGLLIVELQTNIYLLILLLLVLGVVKTADILQVNDEFPIRDINRYAYPLYSSRGLPRSRVRSRHLIVAKTTCAPSTGDGHHGRNNIDNKEMGKKSLLRQGLIPVICLI